MDTKTCFKVKLLTTNSTNSAANISLERYRNPDGYDGEYIPVENGYIFVVADDAAAVGARFPMAVSIERVGIGGVV